MKIAKYLLKADLQTIVTTTERRFCDQLWTDRQQVEVARGPHLAPGCNRLDRLHMIAKCISIDLDLPSTLALLRQFRFSLAVCIRT